MNAVLARPMIARGAKAAPQTVPAPVGGWNTRDALAAMEETDAIVLDNWFPGFGSVVTRRGSEAYANSLGAAVKTLAEFNAGTTRKFLAAANGALWDISGSGAGVSLGSGFGSDAWEWAQFDDGSGGARMGLVNGVDAPQVFTGAALSGMTISGTGLTAAQLNGIHIYRERSYFWDDRTQDFWYSATGALGGTLTKFPLGRVSGTGGNLVAMGTWSQEAGNGPNDYAVFILSSGDVLVYAGSDPGSAADWALVGRYAMAAPIGKRCIVKLGADLIVGTRAGYISLASVFRTGRLNEQTDAISSKIRGAVIDAMGEADSFGWHMVHYAPGPYLLVNVPTATGDFQQHVMNTATQAWCRFIGQQAQVWGLYKNELYYGTAAGTVLKADVGAADNGVPVTASAQTAWNYFDDRTRTKRLTAVRLNFRTEGIALAYSYGVGFDFAPVSLTSSQTIPAASGGATWMSWENNPWDTQVWATEGIVAKRRSGARGAGYAASLALSVASADQRTEWLASTYLLEPAATH